MELTSDEFFERLLLSYSDYFDIIRDTSYKDLSVAAEAAFHSFSEKYVLVKKAPRKLHSIVVYGVTVPYIK